MPNAILIDFFEKIEKVDVDFSSVEGMAKAVDSRGVYTINTQNILDITNKLGFPVVGFVDRYMEESDRINNSLAADISGYDYLLSKMILCTWDSKYNFLPLSDRQVDILYTYLTTGKVINPSSGEEGDLISKFINDYDIENLVTLNVDFKPKARLHPKHANVLVLDYEVPSEQLFSIGEKLFTFSDILVNKFIDKGSHVFMDPNLQYYLSNGFVIPGVKFRITYQAIDSEFEKPFVTEDNVLKIFPED